MTQIARIVIRYSRWVIIEAWNKTTHMQNSLVSNTWANQMSVEITLVIIVQAYQIVCSANLFKNM